MRNGGRTEGGGSGAKGGRGGHINLPRPPNETRGDFANRDSSGSSSRNREQLTPLSPVFHSLALLGSFEAQVGTGDRRESAKNAIDTVSIGYMALVKSVITEWEEKQLKGCVFSPPSLLLVPGRGKETRKRKLSIASYPISVWSIL